MKEAKMTEKELDCLTIPGFSKDGNWYKGNLHSHTIHSDGHLTPEEAVNIYKKHGYHFFVFPNMICIPITAPNLTAKILLFCREWRRPRFYLSRNPLLLGKRYTISMGFSVRKRCRSKRLSRYTTIWKATLSENIMESGTVRV